MLAWLYYRTKSATRFPEQVQLPAAAALAALASPAGLDQWGGMQHSGMNIAAIVCVCPWGTVKARAVLFAPQALPHTHGQLAAPP